MLEKDNFIEIVYIVLSCLIKKRSSLTLFVSMTFYCFMESFRQNSYSQLHDVAMLQTTSVHWKVKFWLSIIN